MAPRQGDAMAIDDGERKLPAPAEGANLRAAVLAYDPLAPGGPRLVAKGHGEIAERMIAIARANGLALHQDAGLLNFLMRVDLDEQIPQELYVAVAAVLALVWNAEREAKGSGGSTP